MPDKSIVEMYSEQKGWRLAKCTLFVEGESDESYLRTAATLHRGKTGQDLIDDLDFTVRAIGQGDDGGTRGIQDQFPTIKNLSDYSVDPEGRRQFRVAAMVDGDSPGKGCAKALVAANRKLLMWRDVFVLNRRLPRKTTDPNGIGRHIDDANAGHRALDTTIEDMIPEPFLDEYFRAHGGYLPKKRRVGDAIQVHVPPDHKAGLARFFYHNAIADDAIHLIEVIRSMRYYLEVPERVAGGTG